MKYIILLLIIVLLTGCASNWSKADTNRQIVVTGLHLIDWAQTRQIASEPDKYYEINPIMGKHPSKTTVDLYMATSLGGQYLVSNLLKPEYRKFWQYMWIGVKTGCVANNFNLGLTGKF